MELQDQIALVTGGGRGLGASICQTLAESGAHVIVADLRPQIAEETAATIRAQGGSAESLGLDVGHESETKRAIDEAVSRHGRLDAVINNAGVDVTLPIDELAIEDWDRIIRTNLRGPYLMSRHVLPVMKQQKSGHIINIVSTAAKRAWPNASAYHASKWGLLGFSYALHAEARPHNVKATAVIAGGMRTPFLLERFPDIDPETLQDPVHVARTVRYLLTMPPESVIPEVMVLPMRETSWP